MTKYTGPERRVNSNRRYTDHPIHPWRWRALTVWCIIFTVLVFWAIRTNRSQISQLHNTKANLVSLERTDCTLRDFLFTAYKVRVSTAKDPKVSPRLRRAARRAAEGYFQLYRVFPADDCDRFIKKAKRKR